MPLRVGIDVSPLALTRAGTARYITGLLAELEDEDSLQLRRYSFGGPGRGTRIVRDTAWYLAALPAAARRDRVEVLHCPSARAPFRSRVPLVVTIHDLAVLRHPAAFNRWTRSYTAFALPRVVTAAHTIVTGSRFTAAGPRKEGRYVLAVATLETRKNLARLVEGFRLAKLGDCELRVVGSAGWGGVTVGGARVRWLPTVDDEELARLYRGAACVAYVSLYEGFGLPVLEAMASGAAVVAPAGPPFQEFAGDVAVGVDPRDASSIAAGLREAVERRGELAAL